MLDNITDSNRVSVVYYGYITQTPFRGFPIGGIKVCEIISYYADMVERTSVSLKDEHAEWVEDNHISLTKFVRTKIDEEMNCERA